MTHCCSVFVKSFTQIPKHQNMCWSFGQKPIFCDLEFVLKVFQTQQMSSDFQSQNLQLPSNLMWNTPDKHTDQILRESKVKKDDYNRKKV